MGGVDSWFDQLDEVKVSTDGYGRSEPPTNSYHGDYNLPCLFTIFILYIYIFYYFLDPPLK